MKNIKLINERYKLSLLLAGNIRKYKKSIVFQHGMRSDGTYINLCNVFEIDSDVWVLMKSKTVGNDYTDKEVVVLSGFLKAILHLKNPKFIEIVTRGLQDRELVERFYKEFQYHQSEWERRLTELIKDPKSLTVIKKMPSPRFDRAKYSIYQLLRDLKKYKSEISLGFLDYKRITTSPSRWLDSPESLSFKKVVGVVGNQEKANQSLLVKDGDVFSTICFIRDGQPWVTKFLVVKTNNPTLKRKLFGARIVTTTVGKNLYFLDIERLPVISKKFIVDEEKLLESLLRVKLEEYYMSKTRIPESAVGETSEVGIKTPVRDKYKYCKLKTRLLTRKLEGLVDEKTPLEYKIRKRELKKSKEIKDEMVFGYLMSKRIKPGTHVSRNGMRILISIKDENESS